MTTQAAQFVGSIPEHYDRYLGPLIFKEFASSIASRAAQENPGATLELAAGTGIVTRQLRDSLPDSCTLVATDLNAPMLDLARAKFDSDESVRFELADAMDLDFDDACFDVIVCQFGVMFFPDKQQSYEEALRVLRPGGRYLFNVWGPLSENPFARIANDVVSSLFPEDPPGFYQVPFGYHDEASMRESLIGAGFSEIETEQVRITSEIPSTEDFSKGLVYGNPLFDEVASRGGSAEAVRAAIADAINGELGSNMPLQATFIEARKN